MKRKIEGKKFGKKIRRK